MEALIKGGLYQNARGLWVNAEGEAVDTNKLPAEVKKICGIKSKPGRKPEQLKGKE